MNKYLSLSSQVKEEKTIKKLSQIRKAQKETTEKNAWLETMALRIKSAQTMM